MSNGNSRAIVARILAELLVSNGSLSTQLNKHRDHPEYSLIQETCYGCCRWFFLLEAILEKLLNKPLKKQDLDLKCLMICALYQLRELEVAEYAVINESVSATKALKKLWSKGLINAVLRGYQRKRLKLEEELSTAEAHRLFSFPNWLEAEISSQWPQQAKQIFDNSNQRPPMTLRVNKRQNPRARYMERLQAENIGATLGKLSDSAIYLDKPAPVNDIPGFNEGLLSIQDEASQLVPGLLHLEPGLRVLDACAAPGGKTCHLIESEDLLTQMVCIDRAQAKLKRIEENLQRLHLQAKLIEADAADTNQWWDGNQFERILLDAPCSATGVIRRHPDIKLLRRPSDIENLTKIQFQLLNNLWACLKPGGLLLYTTCSLLRQENEEVLRRFLDSCDSAKHEAIVADWGVECALGRQLLPSTGLGPDGFFYAVLRKSK